MAGGNPLDLIPVFGFKIPRYRLAAYVISSYFLTYAAYSQYKRFQAPPPPAKLEPEEDAFVQNYIKEWHENRSKPAWVRGDREVIGSGAHH